MAASPKVQRWIDLLAALLGHRMPVTFEELARDVPAYLTDGSIANGNPSATLNRMFERDKVELRELGVPILSIGEDGSDESAVPECATFLCVPGRHFSRPHCSASMFDTPALAGIAGSS
jgi:hypothetical protein